MKQYHVRGPALKTGYLYGEYLMRFPSESRKRSGLNSKASGPQIPVSRPMTHGCHATAAPAGTTVPSGQMSSFTVSLPVFGTGGKRRIDSKNLRSNNRNSSELESNEGDESG